MRRNPSKIHLSAFFMLLLFSITLGFAASSSLADPALGLHRALRELCSGVTGVIPSVSMLMILAGSAIYASGQIMGAETRSRANVWATAALTGAVTGILFATVTPDMLGVVYGDDVNCLSSASHGSFYLCGMGAGDLCCQGNLCPGAGLYCDTSRNPPTCNDGCGNAPGARCCTGSLCIKAAGLYCDTATQTCAQPCGEQAQHCCDPGTCSRGYNCDPAVKRCIGCGQLDEACCRTEQPCDTTANPRIACDTSLGAGRCVLCGNAIGSPCCPDNPSCPAQPSSACDFGTVPPTCAQCGAEGQQCCGTSCSQAWLSCQQGDCRSCGKEGEACCRDSNGSILPAPNDCNAENVNLPLVCSSEKCVYQGAICGHDGEMCCPQVLGEACVGGAQSGLFCNQENVCQHCGRAGEACCENPATGNLDLCTGANVLCDATAAPVPRCYSCGGANQPCCPEQPGPQCAGANSVCTNNVCVACGEVGQPCCGGATCTAANTVCDLAATPAPACVLCGGAGQPCCSAQPGPQCAQGYACGAGSICLTACAAEGATGCQCGANFCALNSQYCFLSANPPSCVPACAQGAIASACVCGADGIRSNGYCCSGHYFQSTACCPITGLSTAATTCYCGGAARTVDGAATWCYNNLQTSACAAGLTNIPQGGCVCGGTYRASGCCYNGQYSAGACSTLCTTDAQSSCRCGALVGGADCSATQYCALNINPTGTCRPACTLQAAIGATCKCGSSGANNGLYSNGYCCGTGAGAYSAATACCPANGLEQNCFCAGTATTVSGASQWCYNNLNVVSACPQNPSQTAAGTTCVCGGTYGANRPYGCCNADGSYNAGACNIPVCQQGGTLCRCGGGGTYCNAGEYCDVASSLCRAYCSYYPTRAQNCFCQSTNTIMWWDYCYPP